MKLHDDDLVRAAGVCKLLLRPDPLGRTGVEIGLVGIARCTDALVGVTGIGVGSAQTERLERAVIASNRFAFRCPYSSSGSPLVESRVMIVSGP